MAWSTFIKDYPGAWRCIVLMYFEVSSPWTEPVKDTADSSPHPFCCTVCKDRPTFKSAKALAQHNRIKHKITNPVSKYVDDSGVCP
eukprot:7359596-Karenia_brevis.AAC.1